MTTPSLGSFSFVHLTGEIAPPQAVVEPIQRPGISGTAWRYHGTKGKAFRVETTAFFANTTLANQAIAAYHYAVATNLTLTDATGASYSVVVEDVRTAIPLHVPHSTHGTGYLVRAAWQLRMPGY